MSDGPTIPKQTAAKRAPRDVMRLLAELVEAQGIGVGDRLPPEVEIASRLGLGRSTVREALRRWESLGIIERNKGAGTRITAEVSTRSMHLPLTVQIEASSLLRMLAVRRPLEVEAVRIATRRATDQARRLIVARAAELLAVHAAGEDWRPADHRFHEAIHHATGNPLFEQIILQLRRGFDDIYEAPFGHAHMGQATIPDHRDLADAIATGDEARAVAVMERILDDVEAESQSIARSLNVER